MVHIEKELIEKLGRNDLCPCKSGRRFQAVLSEDGQVRWRPPRLLLLETEKLEARLPWTRLTTSETVQHKSL
jgi:hypothetical protein